MQNPNTPASWKITYQSPIKRENVQEIEKEMSNLVDQINILLADCRDLNLEEPKAKIQRLVGRMNEKFSGKWNV